LAPSAGVGVVSPGCGERKGWDLEAEEVGEGMGEEGKAGRVRVRVEWARGRERR